MLPFLLSIFLIGGGYMVFSRIISSGQNKDEKKSNPSAAVTPLPAPELKCYPANPPSCEKITSDNHNDARVLIYYLRPSFSFQDLKQNEDEIGDVSFAITKLEKMGWIKEKNDKEILMKLFSVSELKEILRKNHMKISGRKEALVQRLLEKVPFSEFAYKYTNKLYDITEDGQKQLHAKKQDYIQAVIDATSCAKNHDLKGISEIYQLYDDKWGFQHISGHLHTIFADYDVPYKQIQFLYSYHMNEISNSTKFKNDLRNFLVASRLRKPKDRDTLATEFRLINNEPFCCPDIVDLFLYYRDDLPEVDENRLKFIKEGMNDRIKYYPDVALAYYISILIYLSKC